MEGTVTGHPQNPTRSIPVPLIVRTGVMSQEEFDALSSAEQDEVERTAADLCLRYGEDSMRRDRERHRDDLRLIGYL
jgi:hypothetical protein